MRLIKTWSNERLNLNHTRGNLREKREVVSYIIQIILSYFYAFKIIQTLRTLSLCKSKP